MKITKFMRNQKQRTMVQIIDISRSILYDQQKASNQVQEMVNAMVSHEMRNPLNSIVAQNIEKRNLFKHMSEQVDVLKKNDSDKRAIISLENSLTQLNHGMSIQEASADILTFIIQGMLDFAQIKADKFRKNIQ